MSSRSNAFACLPASTWAADENPAGGVLTSGPTKPVPLQQHRDLTAAVEFIRHMHRNLDRPASARSVVDGGIRRIPIATGRLVGWPHTDER